ncbi:MAG TPA: cytochrome C, partial [Verrucomicrobiae bacterium]|nr:cytochrome C [Verrucomicrobiae bacterium]
QKCHGTPHPAALMAKFPKCGDCHSIAHDLNQWGAAGAAPAPEKKEAPKAPAPAKKKK